MKRPLLPTDGASLSRDDVHAHFAGTAASCATRDEALARFDGVLQKLTGYCVDRVQSGRWRQDEEGFTLRQHLEELRACRSALGGAQ